MCPPHPPPPLFYAAAPTPRPPEAGGISRATPCLRLERWRPLHVPARRDAGSPAPQVHRVASRLEAGRLDHLRCHREALAHLVRLVGVAPVLHGLPAHLAPPAHDRDVRAERAAAGGVHLEHPAGSSARDEDGADLLFVILLSIRR